MSQHISFNVEFLFSSKIVSDEDIIAVRDNLMRAIKAEIENGEGIAPDGSDALTDHVRITPEFLTDQPAIQSFKLFS